MSTTNPTPPQLAMNQVGTVSQLLRQPNRTVVFAMPSALNGDSLKDDAPVFGKPVEGAVLRIEKRDNTFKVSVTDTNALEYNASRAGAAAAELGIEWTDEAAFDTAREIAAQGSRDMYLESVMERAGGDVGL